MAKKKKKKKKKKKRRKEKKKKKTKTQKLQGGGAHFAASKLGKRGKQWAFQGKSLETEASISAEKPGSVRKGKRGTGGGNPGTGVKRKPSQKVGDGNRKNVPPDAKANRKSECQRGLARGGFGGEGVGWWGGGGGGGGASP